MNTLIVLLNFFSWFSFQEAAIVAVVNSEPIHEKELKLQMAKERPRVYTYFAVKYSLGEDALVWTQKYRGEIPVEVLKKRALSTAIRIKLQQIGMKHYGIQNDISYSGFDKSFRMMNANRTITASKGETLFGPPQFSESSYFDYIYSNNLNRLQDSLLKDKASAKKDFKGWLDREIKLAEIKVYRARLRKVQL